MTAESSKAPKPKLPPIVWRRIAAKDPVVCAKLSVVSKGVREAVVDLVEAVKAATPRREYDTFLQLVGYVKLHEKLLAKEKARLVCADAFIPILDDIDHYKYNKKYPGNLGNSMYRSIAGTAVMASLHALSFPLVLPFYVQKNLKEKRDRIGSEQWALDFEIKKRDEFRNRIAEQVAGHDKWKSAALSAVTGRPAIPGPSALSAEVRHESDPTAGDHGSWISERQFMNELWKPAWTDHRRPPSASHCTRSSSLYDAPGLNLSLTPVSFMAIDNLNPF